jgi:hypothetical protein
MKDYSKIKALASQILECIGDEPEGGDGTEVQHTEEERGSPGPSKLRGKAMEEPPSEDDAEKHKARRDDVVALLGSVLASKMKSK